MRIAGHGVDMVECERLRASVERFGQRFLNRVFTPAELEYCQGRKREIEHLAGRFAAKEAVLKVLGTGWQKGTNWTDIEIRNDPLGRPNVSLGGRSREIADQIGLSEVLVSISHIQTHAIASAIGCVDEGADRGE